VADGLFGILRHQRALMPLRGFHSRNAIFEIPADLRPGLWDIGRKPRVFVRWVTLIDEWQPSGPTEEDAVFSLADLMWRKHRAQRFIQAKLKADPL
jgi:hypothetical protein